MRINIKKMRRSLGLSQEEFGRKIGCAQTNVSFIEKGVRNTSDETYSKLVAVFGSEFVKRFEEPDIQPSTPATPRNTDELIALIREQQRQTNELIEMLRQTLRMLQNDRVD